jgi:hypothetical protein
MSELDNLFKLDGDLDSLDKNVHQKYAFHLNIHQTKPRLTLPPPRKQAVSTQTQELEALEARLREAEDRLKQASSNSPPRRKNSERRSPITGVFPDQDTAQLKSPLVQRNALAAGAPTTTPSSQNNADYVLVERPRSSQQVEA